MKHQVNYYYYSTITTTSNTTAAADSQIPHRRKVQDKRQDQKYEPKTQGKTRHLKLGKARLDTRKSLSRQDTRGNWNE